MKSPVKPPAQTSLTEHRPDIEGLRGVSVLAVLFYHAQISFPGITILPGGFLGVDIFYTISGFVITQVILREFEKTGKFSVTNFYIKRGRRLLPALVSMIFVSTIFAWLILLPSQLVDFSQSVLYAVSFLSNLYWLDTLTAYGAESSQLKPLLHTWSLAVEGQFYIAYPLFILLFLHRDRTNLLLILVLLSLASLATMLSIATNEPALSFYSLPTRLWEISTGAGLAIFSSAQVGKEPKVRGDTILAMGFALVALPLSIGTTEGNHPGLGMIAITLGTSIILLTTPSAKYLKTLLSNQFFKYLGLRSYSIYIWHFPVFAFYRNNHYEQPFLWTLSLLLGTLLLSELSYRWIESPFRSTTNKSSAVLLVFLAPGLALSLIPAAYAIKTEGVKSRFPDWSEIYGRNEFDNGLLKKRSNSIRRQLARDAGADSVFAHEQNFLWFTKQIHTKKILIVGNSHAKNMFIALHQNKEKFPDFEFAMYRMQIDSQSRNIEHLTQSRNFIAADIILISTNFREDSTRRDITALPRFVDELQSMGKTVVLTSNSPKFINYGKDTVFDRLRKTSHGALSLEIINSTYFKTLDKSVIKINERLKKFANRKGIAFLDKFDFSCDMNISTCSGVTPEGLKIYFDGEHYTVEGAKYLGAIIYSRGWLTDINNESL